MNEHEKDSRKLLDRIVMFNDAVYAIALTLLVLELKLPEGKQLNSSSEMIHYLREMTPRFMAFALSVAMVGGNWYSAINIQRTMVRADKGLVVFIIIYLVIIAIMPFCCNLIGSYPNNPISFVVFGIVLIMLILNALFFMKHCRKNKLYHDDVDLPELLKLEKSMPLITLLVIGMVAVAFYSTTISFYMLLIYNLLPFILTKSLRINHKD